MAPLARLATALLVISCMLGSCRAQEREQASGVTTTPDEAATEIRAPLLQPGELPPIPPLEGARRPAESPLRAILDEPLDPQLEVPRLEMPALEPPGWDESEDEEP